MSIVITDRRGNVEQRAVLTQTTLAAPAEWLTEAFGGATASGISVTRQQALTISAVWKAILLISTDIAKAPLNLWRDQGTSKSIQRDHPKQRLLRYKPNYFQRSFDYKGQLTVHKLLYGCSFAMKIMDGRGEVVELLPLLPDTVAIYRDRGKIYYDVTLSDDVGNLETYRLDASQVVSETWLSFDGISGVGALQSARETLARIIAMRTYGASVFKNSARPASVIKTTTNFKDDAARERFVESWQRMHSGAENAHKTAVLPPGMELQSYGMNAKDSQLVEIEQQCVRDVGNFFLMPASKLNDMTKSSYNSLEQDALAYLADCLEGHLVSMEEAYNDSLLSIEEQMDGYYFQFDRKAIRVADLKTLGEYYSKSLGNNSPWLTPNEIRADFGLNPVEGGDKLPTQQGPTPTGNAPDPDPEQDTEDPPNTDDERAVYVSAMSRAITKSVADIKRAFKRGGAVDALATAGAVNTCKAIRESLDPAVSIYGRCTGTKPNGVHGLALELVSVVQHASAGEPETFEERINELTQNLTERLCNV